MKRQKGQALVELALVAPLLLVLMAATFEFAWTYYQLYQLNSAARVGARVAAAQLGAKPPMFDHFKITNSVNGTLNGGVALSFPPTVVVSSCTWPTVQDWKYGGPGVGAVPAPMTSQSGKLCTVYIKSIYWPFTRLWDLRNFGHPSHFQVSSTFVVR